MKTNKLYSGPYGPASNISDGRGATGQWPD
jgi:hypothetical protein